MPGGSAAASGSTSAGAPSSPWKPGAKPGAAPAAATNPAGADADFPRAADGSYDFPRFTPQQRFAFNQLERDRVYGAYRTLQH